MINNDDGFITMIVGLILGTPQPPPRDFRYSNVIGEEPTLWDEPLQFSVVERKGSTWNEQ